jgi:plastocyanin
MTWPWLISFSALTFLPILAGSLNGTVELVDSRDKDARQRQDYSGVVVWLEPILNGFAAPPSRPQNAKMIQKEKQFVPHILAVPVASSVEFPNFDPIFHNAFSSFSGQIFDIGLYAPGTSRTVHFNRSGIVRVFCNIHPTMSAIIVVVNTPWFAVTHSSGSFEIPAVSPGEYWLRFFHERATESTLNALARRIKVGANGMDLPVTRISETGYAAAPHKNKYGKDYPPPAEDHVLYPGARK